MNVNVDQRLVQVPEGATALDALRAAGLDVPTACSDPRLQVSGACRLCLVKVARERKWVSSCAYRVQEGDEITVEDAELEDFRRDSLRLLAREYPAEYVEAFPEKPLHQWFRRYGVEAQGRSSTEQIDATNPYFRFDPAACIECYRCVRICDEVEGAFVWEIAGRGFTTHVQPNAPSLAESSCKSCGACSDACPSGALVDLTRIEEGRPDTWTRTTCPYCGVGCELNVGTKNGRMIQVLPVMDALVNKGHLCVKGRYAHQYVYAKDRMTEPMIRPKGGDWQVVSWDEAIGFAASEMQRIERDHGPGKIGVLGSARAPNEDNYLAQKFARLVLNTNNIDCCARVCHGPTAAAMKKVLGTGAATNSFDDIERSAGFFVIGCNPTENHPIVGERIKQAVRKGAKLIVIDPRRIELAKWADVHVSIRPGTNVPLLHAMAKYILDEGLAAQEFLDRRVDGFDAYRRAIEPWTIERAAAVCGADPDLIRQAARLYATTGPAMMFHGLGMTEHLQGSEGVMCLVNLALVAGNIGKPGSGVNPLRGQNNVQGSAHMGCEPSNLTGFVSLDDGFELFSRVWGSPPPLQKGLNLLQMLDSARDGELKALWAIGYDVAFTNPRSTSAASFQNMELVIVQDLFLNETARDYAHVFLPAASSFEREGTFMNAERRVQRVRKAIEPPGNAKPDYEIIQLLARALGRPEGFAFESAEAIWNEVRQVWKPGGGMSYARLDERGLQWPCTTEDHPGTTILHQSSFPIGDRAMLQPVEFVPTPEVTSPEFPFVLNTGRTLAQFNAGTMTARTRNQQIRPEDTLDMHPDDAAALGLKNGDAVRVRSHYGDAVLPMRLDPGLRRGEVFATFHTRDIFLNKVTSPVRDRIVGAPEYKVTAVNIERA